MEKFEGHMRYRYDCPPAGLMMRNLMESLGGTRQELKQSVPLPKSNEISSTDDVHAFIAGLGAGAKIMKKKAGVNHGAERTW